MTNTVKAEFSEILEYLDSFTNYERKVNADSNDFGLDGIKRLLQRCNNPQNDFKAIHIAGTKGKGSTATMIAMILQESGLRVGLYTSPHLIDIRERIKINNELVSKEFFCKCFNELQIKQGITNANNDEHQFTYFEIITALAFIAFSKSIVDVAIIETGLGGRLDATNIINPTVCGITPISIDHTTQLGSSIENIAAEKGGIIKPAIPTIFGKQTNKAKKILKNIATKNNCPYIFFGEENFNYELSKEITSINDSQIIDIITPKTIHKDIKMSVLGTHQLHNATLACTISSSFLEQTKREIKTENIKSAFNKIKLPGRIEVISSSPWMLLDGAHNKASILALIDTIEQRFLTNNKAKVNFIVAFAKDKDIEEMLKTIIPVAENITITEFNHPRCQSAEKVAKLVSELSFTNIKINKNSIDAIIDMKSQTKNNDLICITGSLYLVGEIHRIRDKYKFRS